jgi:hypothetical protein
MNGLETTFGRSGHTALSLQEQNMNTLSIARTGGSLPSNTPSRTEIFGVERDQMLHMPLDTGIHWTWNNPLNIIPASIVAVVVVDIVSLFM